MTNLSDNPNPLDPTNAEMERLLAAVSGEPVRTPAPAVEEQSAEGAGDGPKPLDFSNLTLLAPRQLRKLKLHQESFAAALAARLSTFLRLDFTLRLTRLQTTTYHKLAESWGNPTHLTLFKAEPLRGISVIEIEPKLGLTIVDRMMGGPGRAPEEMPEMSEIEKALLEQIVELVLGEWCLHWKQFKDLKPVLLGSETSGKFVQVATRDTTMLVLVLDGKMNDSSGTIQLAFPFSALEPFISELCQDSESSAPVPASPRDSNSGKWNPGLNELPITLTAEWHGLEVTAREVLNLKTGDVLKLDAELARFVKVKLGEETRFNARLGTIAGNWAMELTEKLKS